MTRMLVGPNCGDGIIPISYPNVAPWVLRHTQAYFDFGYIAFVTHTSYFPYYYIE